MAYVQYMYAVDHVYVWCSTGAPEGEALRAIGFVEGSSNAHRGQGTACRRFYFNNAYLELMWIVDASEAASELTRPTGLLKRWTGRHDGTSPFGVAVRPDAPASADEPPFEAWPYTPMYLPEGRCIDMATGVPLMEPAMFFLSFGGRPDAAKIPQAMTHPLGVSELTAVEICSPSKSPLSPAARALESRALITFRRGEAHVMVLTFDHGRRGIRLDLRPSLPLVLEL